jgi:2-C-methyl-D-erythritol 4-phosphate cytidylyltransferase
MEIIIPAAGLSTRFPNMRPKYSLTDYSGNLMLKSAVMPYIGKYKINIGILKQHEEEHSISTLLKHEFKKDINIIVIDKPTKGPADTVYQIIKKCKSKFKQGFLIKDCDSFFDHQVLDENYICISKFSNNNLIKTPASKSYILSNDQGIVQNIVEKKVISDKFCVGGYRFKNIQMYINAFNAIKNNNTEIFVSNIIQHYLANNNIFIENVVSNYIDVGTAQEWFKYNDKSVIFCDIDGTIIQAQAKNDYKKQAIPLQNNVKILKELLKKGNQIIFVTARPESARKQTISMLNNLGFLNCQLIMNLLNCKRILINDFNNANPYPRAKGINIPRDSDTLNLYLKTEYTD